MPDKKIRTMMDEIAEDNAVGVKYMLVSEWVREKEVTWLEKGREEGREEGLASLITKKIKKGKTVSDIAEELETDDEEIQKLIKKYQLI